MQRLSNEERTFGLELEFGDLLRDKVNLPNLYKYSLEEKSIVNTNAKKSSPKGNIGGEVNTRPLYPNSKDVRELRRFIKSCLNENEGNGQIMWNTGFDGHLYIGDLGLDELKKIFALAFYISPLINKIFNLGEWFDVEHLVPTPNFFFNERVQKCETLDNLKNTFANSSNRGHYRFQINIMSYFTTKTLEFRIFNGTNDFRRTLETIKFMYNFLNYALDHDIEDYKKIKTEDDFFKCFNVKNIFPKKVSPLIFAESHTVATTNVSKAFKPSRKIITAIKNSTLEDIAIVNPFYYSTELGLYKNKNITIYNNNEYNDVIYQICEENLSITYKDQFEILNNYKNKKTDRELALFFIFTKIQKFNMTTEYGIKEFNSYAEKIEESIEKIEKSCDEFLEMFGECKYKKGTLNDAINDGNRYIVFQQEHNPKNNTVVSQLKKHSDYNGNFVVKEMSYANIQEKLQKNNVVNFEVLSRNDFLPFHKIAKDIDVTLYSTQDLYEGTRFRKPENLDSLNLKIPQNDYVITENSKIKIQEIKPTYFSILQHRFVKKVSKFKTPRMCYVIVDENDVVLGAFGFDYSKEKDYDLFLLSDFCTNNDIMLLSKFVLFMIMTKELKNLIEEKLIERVKKGYTKIYTTMPVSMKYRGAFKKVDEMKNYKSLAYDFEFGQEESIQSAIKRYLKLVENRNKDKSKGK